MIKKLLVTAVALAGFSGSQAVNVSGDVKFSIKIPEIIVLYHWDSAALTLTSGASQAASDNTAHTASTALGTTPYDFTGTAINGTGGTGLPASVGTMVINLKNSWGVRSIAATDPTLALSASTGAGNGYTLTNTATTPASTLTITNAVLNCATPADCGSQGSASTTVTKGWALKTGDIQFSIDLSNATAGTYVSGGNTTAPGNTFNLNFSTP